MVQKVELVNKPHYLKCKEYCNCTCNYIKKGVIANPKQWNERRIANLSDPSSRYWDIKTFTMITWRLCFIQGEHTSHKVHLVFLSYFTEESNFWDSTGFDDIFLIVCIAQITSNCFTTDWTDHGNHPESEHHE